MDDSRFDRLARAFAAGATRRALLAAAGGFAAALGARLPVLAQIAPATCGGQGDVCTMLMGCCDGFTCVTSLINVNYGVCVPGEGGTVAATTSLISPFSDESVAELTALASEAATTTSSSTTTTSDADAEREARRLEIEARKDARRNKRELRRDTVQARKVDRREDQEFAAGPKVFLELFNPGSDKPLGGSAPETIRVTNVDDVRIVLVRIEELGNPVNTSDHDSDFPETGLVLDVGESFLFVADGTGYIPGSDRHGWIETSLCKPDVDDDGFVVYVAFSTNSENHARAIFCSEASVATQHPDIPRRRKKKRRKNKKR